MKLDCFQSFWFFFFSKNLKIKIVTQIINWRALHSVSHSVWMALSKLVACIAMIFSFIWTNCGFYEPMYTSIWSSHRSAHGSHSLAADLSLCGNGHSMREKELKRNLFLFLFIQRDHNLNTYLWHTSTVHHIFHLYSIPILDLHIEKQKKKNVCMSNGAGSISISSCPVVVNRQHWMNDTMMWSFRRPFLTHFFLGVCFDSKFFDFTIYESYAHAFNAYTYYLYGFFSPFNILIR